MSNKTTTVSRFVEIDEIAADFGVHVRTIERMVQRGDFPQPLRFGRRKVWLRRKYLNLIDQKQREAERSL